MNAKPRIRPLFSVFNLHIESIELCSSALYIMQWTLIHPHTHTLTYTHMQRDTKHATEQSLFRREKLPLGGRWRWHFELRVEQNSTYLQSSKNAQKCLKKKARIKLDVVFESFDIHVKAWFLCKDSKIRDSNKLYCLSQIVTKIVFGLW